MSKEINKIILKEVRKELFNTNKVLKVRKLKITHNKKQGQFTKT